MARVLFHIDLNAFFASAEELRHPEYKDKPLAVGSLSARGVISTCNYKAREYGIHSAMPVMQAKSMCEDLILVKGDMAYYKSLSAKFFEYLRRFSGALEVLSIDECFLDVTEVIRRYKRPLDLAVQIQQGLCRELGLCCSIGVAPTRFLAKMASDLRKPLGITVLRKSEIETKLFPLDVGACIGIGKKTVPLLKEAGIQTIGDLADPKNEQAGQKILMNSWHDIQDKIHGRSSDQLVFSTTRKSISHSRTFGHDLYTLEETLGQCRLLCQELCASMQKAGRKGSQVSVVMRDVDFVNKVHSRRLSMPTDSFALIYEAASALVLEYFEPVGYRHLGVSVGSLLNEENIVLQPTLFDFEQDSTAQIISSFNERLDGSLLMSAGDLLKKERENKAPAKQKEQEKKQEQEKEKEKDSPQKERIHKPEGQESRKEGSARHV